MTPNALVIQARQYLGVRFAHQGRSRKTGVDCLGLLLCVAQDLGIRLRQQDVRRYDRTDYRAFPDVGMLRSKLDHALEKTEQMQAGDIVLLKVDGRPQHLALICDHPQGFGMIHAYAPLRKVVEHRLDEQWHNAIEQAYRVPLG